MRTIYPSITKELRDLALDYNERLKLDIAPNLFKNPRKVHEEGLSFLVKYSFLMTNISLKELSDSEYLKVMTAYAINNFAHMITDNFASVSLLSKFNLQNLLQVPYIMMSQLIEDGQDNQEHTRF
jgi:hypothetical protein